MDIIVIFTDTEYYGGNGVREHHTDCGEGLTSSQQCDIARDSFHSTDEYMQWADQYTAQQMGELEDHEFRFEILGFIIGERAAFNFVQEGI